MAVIQKLIKKWLSLEIVDWSFLKMSDTECRHHPTQIGTSC